ncbi:exocyst complex component EXO70H1-like [Euphorbia lathyris]|uniref:exocyst complex component EXO70H1-like n=1 Tax=Euphorbia lathyris TaxID=212925 RepID=UPI003313203A
MAVSEAINGRKGLSFPTSPLPSSPKSMILDNIQDAELIIRKWDIIHGVSISLFHNPDEAKQFLKCVKNLRQSMHFFASQHSASNKLSLAQNLMEISMKRLQKELFFLLSSHPENLTPSSVSSVSSPSSDGSSNFEEEMSDLKLIADCMISSGYTKECIQIYQSVRKSKVEEGLYQLGIEKIRSSQIRKLNSEVLQSLINNWQNGVKVAVRTVFTSEKSLCDHVFSSSQTIRESCFSYITREAAMDLFKFPLFVAKIKRSPERIFPLMELYETILNLWPEIEVTFSSESTSSVQLQVVSSLQRLGESVRAVLSDFESIIQNDSSKTLVIGGGIHPLTRTVMNYISSLSDYSSIPVPDSPLLESNEDSSAVSVYFAWLILVLLCKLDRKAKGYKDVALSYLFLANNLQFIIVKVCETQLKFILGEDWISEHSRKVKQYASGYELMGWNRVFSSLPDKNGVVELSDEVAKEHFEMFNEAFEGAYKKQKSWIVEDGKLRDELKVSIGSKLVPVYREFYNSFLGIQVRFDPDDVGNCLSELFHGAEIIDGRI